jgi:hypothetical protein
MRFICGAPPLSILCRVSSSLRAFSQAISIGAQKSRLLMTISEEAGISGQDTPSLVKSLQSNGFISSPDVAAAFLRLDRAFFGKDPAAPPPSAPYSNAPLRLAFSETMTSPAMHARCVQALYSTNMLVRGAVCADVGSGSGFVAAALAILAGSSGRVVAVERIEFVKQALRCNDALLITLSNRYLVDRARDRLSHVLRGGSDFIGGNGGGSATCDFMCSDALPPGETFDVIHVYRRVKLRTLALNCVAGGVCSARWW